MSLAQKLLVLRREKRGLLAEKAKIQSLICDKNYEIAQTIEEIEIAEKAIKKVDYTNRQIPVNVRNGKEN